MGIGIVKYIKYLADSILEVVYPEEENCIVCKEELKEAPICRSCVQKIKFCEQATSFTRKEIFFNCYSIAYYSGVMMELIIRLKYKKDFTSGKILAKFIAERIKKEKLEFDIITYVPSRKEVLKKRGYNQTELIAKAVARELNREVIPCLRKIKDTKDQIGLDKVSRWNNMESSFAVVNNKKMQGKRIILIDDVITTGATVFSCVQELIKNGALEVIVLTAAKSKI